MKIINKMDRHEMLRRWALGEVYSTFYTPNLESERKDAVVYLQSGIHSLESEGINSVLKYKQTLIDSISPHISWYRAILEPCKSDLDFIYTLQLPGWLRNTGGTYLVADAARNLYEQPKMDVRVAKIYKALLNNTVVMEGITLLAIDKIGPYVAIEGTGRLTSIYIAHEINELRHLRTERIEVSLGLY